MQWIIFARYQPILKIYAAAMVLFCSLPLLSQSSLNTTLEGRWAIGHCLAADASGSLVYYANGGFLIIADVSDPANPVEVGKIAVPARIYGMAVSGDFAYLADAFEGLQIIDLSPLPSSTLPYHSYYGDGAIQGQLNKGHALHVDTVVGEPVDHHA